MIRHVLLLLLTLCLLFGVIWIADFFLLAQFINPEKVHIFDFDIFGVYSIAIFGFTGLCLVGVFHRFAEVIKNKHIEMPAKPFWIAFAILSVIGLIVNYANYFKNIRGYNLVECQFHSQRHRDWMIKKYARSIEECQKYVDQKLNENNVNR
ncbi:hypothetical protein [uncultured Shewanella sp.]|uniref:hypothetical protein n=1 Tax=uncultured Shewanella sp. TaxID=173975 RepID=UPI00261C6647|nr:hypothetical protein [uncultured Shewanella sp.]